MSEVADFLRRARALIADPENWGQGPVADRHERCCAYLALHKTDVMEEEVFGRAIGLFCRTNGIVGSIVRWNDAPERTHAEVLAAFDKAIEAGS